MLRVQKALSRSYNTDGTRFVPLAYNNISPTVSAIQSVIRNKTPSCTKNLDMPLCPNGKNLRELLQGLSNLSATTAKNDRKIIATGFDMRATMAMINGVSRKKNICAIFVGKHDLICGGIDNSELLEHKGIQYGLLGDTITHYDRFDINSDCPMITQSEFLKYPIKNMKKMKELMPDSQFHLSISFLLMQQLSEEQVDELANIYLDRTISMSIINIPTIEEKDEIIKGIFNTANLILNFY